MKKAAAKPSRTAGRIPIPSGKYDIIPRGCEKLDGRWYFPPGWLPWQAHLWRFGVMPHGEEKLKSWRGFIESCWPDPVFIWDEWADLSFGAFCGAKETIERITGKSFQAEHKFWECTIMTGCASSGKSARAALWILGNWLVAREHTAAILTSTSVDLLSKRIWSDILTWIDLANVKFPLRSVPSDLELRWNDSDRKHAVFGVAVKSGGNPTEAAHRIHGIHARRTYIVVDEMPSVAKAIVDASRNIRIGTDETQFIGLGNASSKTDPHGERCEPIDGWNSITDTDQFWITRLGCCVHLDARRSPGLQDSKRFHFYPKQEDMDRDAREMGGANSPLFWSYIIGFWAPTGLSSTLIDDALLTQFNTSEPAIWQRKFTMGAAFDPSFEGQDRSILYPFKFGTFSNGLFGIEYQEPIILAVDLTQDKRWIHYALSDLIESHCKNINVEPENFIEDITGEAGGLHAILSARWSPKINGVEFGGAADKTQMYRDRPITWHESVGNKVSMIWMMFRSFVEGGQVRRLVHSETIRELTSRIRIMKGGKIIAEPKKDMKKRGLRSPDFADSCVLGTFLLYLKGFPPGGSSVGLSVNLEKWNESASKNYVEEDYSDEYAGFL